MCNWAHHISEVIELIFRLPTCTYFWSTQWNTRRNRLFKHDWKTLDLPYDIFNNFFLTCFNTKFTQPESFFEYILHRPFTSAIFVRGLYQTYEALSLRPMVPLKVILAAQDMSTRYFWFFSFFVRDDNFLNHWSQLVRIYS